MKRKRTRLTPWLQARLLEDYRNGVTSRVLAYRYGCHRAYPTVLARRRGVPMKGQGRHA